MTLKNLKIQSSLIAILALFWFNGAVFAHSISSTFTTIEWNDGDGSLEIIVQGHSHELEILFSLEVGEKISFLDDNSFERLQEAAGKVLLSDITILVDDSRTPVKLNYIGLELKGQTVFAYLEANLPKAPESMLVSNLMFVGVMPGQVNTVMGVVGGKRRAEDIHADNRSAFLDFITAEN